jgi:hypothetical protein
VEDEPQELAEGGAFAELLEAEPTGDPIRDLIGLDADEPIPGNAAIYEALAKVRMSTPFGPTLMVCFGPTCERVAMSPACCWSRGVVVVGRVVGRWSSFWWLVGAGGLVRSARVQL